MNKPGLTSVEAALSLLIEAAQARILEVESVPVAECSGRVLVADLHAQRSQPPYAVSSMDGYAVQAADTDPPGQVLTLIGESAAGHRFYGAMTARQCVRIFTGAAVPEGSDAVLIQENALVEGANITPQARVMPGKFIRPAAADFSAGDCLLKAGTRLSINAMALAAAMNHPLIPVARRPKIAVLATGDELAEPGLSDDPDKIIASNAIAVCAIARAYGAETRDLGIAKDTRDSLMAAFAAAQAWGADVLVTIGGASVGAHDLVRHVAAELGARQSFYKIAMRPGKPLNFGSLGSMLLLGLPGNPVSSILCARLFLSPLVLALQGDHNALDDRSEPATLGTALPANDERQDYLRARLSVGTTGAPIATAFLAQDSSLLARLAEADALIVRPPFAPAAPAGDACRILRLSEI